jgi:stringent starvation protein B
MSHILELNHFSFSQKERNNKHYIRNIHKKVVKKIKMGVFSLKIKAFFGGMRAKIRLFLSYILAVFLF